jgi:hypothetical protein
MFKMLFPKAGMAAAAILVQAVLSEEGVLCIHTGVHQSSLELLLFSIISLVAGMGAWQIIMEILVLAAAVDLEEEMEAVL